MAQAVVAKKLSAKMNMCEGPLLKKIIAFFIPIYFTSALQLLFNTADLIIVGRSGNSLSVGAVGATSSLIHLVVNLFMGFSSGIGVVVATHIGEKNEDAVRKTIHTAIPLSIICGAIVNLLLFFGAYGLLNLMNTPSDIIGLSTTYVKIYAFGMIPSMLYNFCAAILRAEGDTLKPLMFLTLAGVINVMLNLVFVLCFGMDVGGVALATAISQAVSATLAVTELIKRNDSAKLYLRKIRLHKTQLKRILTIGLPAGIQGTTFSISNVIIQSSINSFSSVAVSGSAAAASIGSFVYCGIEALQQTAMNFTGQNYGAKKLDRVRRTLFLCSGTVFVLEIILGGIANVFAKPLLSLYITDSAKAIDYGSRRLLLVTLFYFLGGIMQVLLNVIRGMGHSLFPMLISIFSNCVFRIFWVTVVFAHFRKSPYAWEILFSSYPISWTIAIVLGIIVYMFVMRKEKRLIKAS